MAGAHNAMRRVLTALHVRSLQLYLFGALGVGGGASLTIQLATSNITGNTVSQASLAAGSEPVPAVLLLRGHGQLVATPHI